MSDKESKYPAHEFIVGKPSLAVFDGKFLHSVLSDEFNQLRQSQQQNAELIRELISVLEFYANPENWTPQGIVMRVSKSGPFSGGMKADMGVTAKAAIQTAEAALLNQRVDAQKLTKPSI